MSVIVKLICWSLETKSEVTDDNLNKNFCEKCANKVKYCWQEIQIGKKTGCLRRSYGVEGPRNELRYEGLDVVKVEEGVEIL
jgi:hypothetical protein